MSTYQEHRHFTRIPFDAHVTLSDNQSGTHQLCELIDICLKGALTTQPTNWQCDKDKLYQLTLNLSDSVDTELKMEVRVAHNENNHIGFEITHMDLDTATHLHRLVELNLGDEKLLERELYELVGGLDSHPQN